MTNEELKSRTKKFSISILNLVELLPNKVSTRVVSNQISKSATSVGVNYRAVCRSRSDKEFVSKMNIVLEEADETLFWLELIGEMNWIKKEEVQKIWLEGNELTAIFVSSLKTINARLNLKSKTLN